MTVEHDVKLPWDSFLEKELNELPEAYAISLRTHINAFRKSEWPQIKLKLRQTFVRGEGGALHAWEIPDGMEPHWVSPGRAILWQRQIVRERRERATEEGGRERYLEEVDKGWMPTAPVLINDASIFASVLQRGLRMRPPYDGVDAETLRLATPSEGLVESESEPVPKYICAGGAAHPDEMKFPSWKAYIKHTSHRKEAPDMEQCPESILKRAQQYQWYCFIHNVGYSNERHAQRHIKDELRKAGRSVHPTIQQMEVTT
jgi:hypothetical protein